MGNTHFHIFNLNTSLYMQHVGNYNATPYASIVFVYVLRYNS